MNCDCANDDNELVALVIRCSVSPEWCCSCQRTGRASALAWSASANRSRTTSAVKRSTMRAGPCMVQATPTAASIRSKSFRARVIPSVPCAWSALTASPKNQGMVSLTTWAMTRRTMKSTTLARRPSACRQRVRSEEHTSELQSPCNLVCRLLLEKKKKKEDRTLALNEIYKNRKEMEQ